MHPFVPSSIYPSLPPSIFLSRRMTVAHLSRCCLWRRAGSCSIPLLGSHCPHRCTTARWSSWRSCCQHSWGSCLSLFQKGGGNQSHNGKMNTLENAGTVMGHEWTKTKHVLSQICLEPDKDSRDTNAFTSRVPIYSGMLYFRCTEAIHIFAQ